MTTGGWIKNASIRLVDPDVDLDQDGITGVRMDLIVEYEERLDLLTSQTDSGRELILQEVAKRLGGVSRLSGYASDVKSALRKAEAAGELVGELPCYRIVAGPEDADPMTSRRQQYSWIIWIFGFCRDEGEGKQLEGLIRDAKRAIHKPEDAWTVDWEAS